MIMMKRFLSLILVTLALVACFSITVSAQSITNETGIDVPDEAGAVYLYSYDGNRALISRGTDIKRAPSATVKMMTGLIVCSEYADILNKKITVTSDMLVDVEGITMGLREGMTVTVTDLLYGAVCGGNNDAAQALAIACAGTVDSFVEEMNKYARRLDMRDTTYKNPTGLDHPDASTTLADTAKLAATSAKNELYLKVSSAKSYDIHSGSETLTVYNRNALISQFSAQGYINKTVSGLIAGNTDEGGYVLAAYAEKNGIKLLCVIMGADGDSNEIYSYYTANKLLEHVFSSYKKTKIITKNESVLTTDVSLALDGKDSAYISCIAEKDIYAFIPLTAKKEDVSFVTYLHNDEINAPIQKGAVVGGIDVYYNNVYITSEKLICDTDIEPNFILLSVTNMKNMLMGRVFLMTLIISAAMITIYVLILRKDRRHKRVSKIQFKKFY